MGKVHKMANAAVQQTTPVKSELELELERLRAQNAALLATVANKGKVTLKVSEKGCVSVYGLGRFPVTLYRGQMEKLLGEKENILAFIEANASKLAVKVQ